MLVSRLSIAGLLVVSWVLSGCSGVQTFPNTVRAGETAALAAGWKHTFTTSNITVTITPSDGIPVVIPAGDPAIRGVVNLYPDPVSWLVVGTETGQSNGFNSGSTYGSILKSNFTGGDNDWWQTTVFVDIPPGLPAGPAVLDISNSSGETASSTIQIVPGSGVPDEFDAELNGPLTPTQMAALGRADHFVVEFSGSVVPHAVQLDLLHDPDAASGGVGEVHVANPRGDIKALSWTDDGTRLRVLLTATRDRGVESLTDFKFYVAGGITGLQLQSVDVLSFDANGNPLSGVTASVTQFGP